MLIFMYLHNETVLVEICPRGHINRPQNMLTSLYVHFCENLACKNMYADHRLAQSVVCITSLHYYITSGDVFVCL